MKVLVTGGAGFIGSNIVKALEDKGAKVIVLDNFSHSGYKNLLDVKAEIICADILDESIYKKLPKLDAVFHEAAVTDTILKDDTKMMDVNFNGFKNVLNFCVKKNIKFVYASSAGVYGDSHSPMVENQECIPHNIYGYSKYLGDCFVRKLWNNNKTLPTIVGLRYFNVYGPGEYHKGSSASITYQLYLQMKEKINPRVFKYGEQKRDFIYVKDIVKINLEALNSNKSVILNVGTGKARSFNDIIAILNKEMKLNLKTEYFDNPYKDTYQNLTEADTTLLNKTLKVKADFSLEKGIGDYINNYLFEVN
ncbi:MAG: ADP-glyceromanno-heptose 6-epimerase [Candidatus Omnitrophica bacterium]|nr:ADP-glyceromanno-heptose 6-epimerase [Candidatus Omnitrophota bacterium]